MTATAADLDCLLADPPAVHGETTYSLVGSTLRWLADRPRPLRTLETGCGLSTIVFAMRGDEHVCITPNGGEAEAVKQYCETAAVALSNVTFLIEPSELILPTIDIAPRDLILIDGSHSFPQVFIDYFYAAAQLAVGGYMIVDDVHLWTGRVLEQFLRSEPDWRLQGEWDGRTVAFRKVQEAESRVWMDQPFVWRRSGPWRARARMASSLVRSGDYGTLLEYVRGLVRPRNK
jgi:predicted O-methyltransferase YrrM